MNLATFLVHSSWSADNVSFMDKEPKEKMCQVSPAVLCKFDQKQKAFGCFLVQIDSLVFRKGDSPAQKYWKFPVMHCTRFEVYEGLGKVAIAEIQ